VAALKQRNALVHPLPHAAGLLSVLRKSVQVFTMATESKERESNLAVNPFCQIEHVFSESGQGRRAQTVPSLNALNAEPQFVLTVRMWCWLGGRSKTFDPNSE